MLYRKNIKNGDMISQLAFGCMRFKSEAETEKQIALAVQKGVNYFDTAYIYPGSEAMLGRILSKLGLRENVKIATKMPTYLVKKYEDLDKYFNTQLQRLKTNYIDYYLMHMLTSVSEWERLKSIGIIDWINAKKADGSVKNLGFSYHGGAGEYIKLIDNYNWDFSMIQYNYLDEFNQAGKNGLLYAAEKNIPIMIMEPLRGGKLVNKLPKNAVSLFEKAEPKRSPAQWAFRWIYNHPQVLTVLSGMNSEEMILENVKTASEAEADSFTEKDYEIIKKAKIYLNETAGIGCTGCNYCMPCPFGVDIPFCFSTYNDIHIEGKLKSKFNYITRANKRAASQCRDCGKCETHCPQGIEIRKELVKVKKAFEGGLYKPLRFTARKVMNLDK